MISKIKTPKTTEEVKRRFFKPFFIAAKRQEKVYGQIREHAKGDFDFYLMTFLAGVIITLGLMIDSSVVIIGGMLIAPFVWPILALSLAISMGRSRLLQTSVFTILKATLIILVVSTILGLISPELVVQSEEFLSRTSPTLFELLIGLAAGFAGAFIMAYPKMGSAIAGVTIAAAVVPPIAVIGLSLAKGDFDLVGGAALLYLSNLIAIVFAATILFLISNFTARTEQAEEKRKSGFRWTMLFLVVIIIPLVLITKEAVLEVKQSKVIKNVVYSSLENVEILEMNSEEENGILTIDLTLTTMENITNNQIAAIEKILISNLKQIVILKVKVVPLIDIGKELLNNEGKF